MIEEVVQALRADFPMNAHERQPQSILVALVHETLKAGTFNTIADLSEAVKVRAARLRIPYDVSGITEALHVVSRTRRLVRDMLPRLTPPPEELPAVVPVPPEVATRILTELRRRVGVRTPAAGLRSMPPAPRPSRLPAAARRALAMLTLEIATTRSRCDDLEREP